MNTLIGVRFLAGDIRLLRLDVQPQRSHRISQLLALRSDAAGCIAVPCRWTAPVARRGYAPEATRQVVLTATPPVPAIGPPAQAGRLELAVKTPRKELCSATAHPRLPQTLHFALVALIGLDVILAPIVFARTLQETHRRSPIRSPMATYKNTCRLLLPCR